MVDGLLGEEEPVGELGVGEAVGEQREHLELAGRETGRGWLGSARGGRGGSPDRPVGDLASGPCGCRRLRSRRAARCPPERRRRTRRATGRRPATTGSRVRSHTAAAPSQSPSAMRAKGSGTLVRAGASIPTVRRHQSASATLPVEELVGGERVEGGQLPAAASRSSALQAASARATATGMIRWTSPVGAARSRASSSRSSAVRPVAAPERDGPGHDESGYAADRRGVRVPDHLPGELRRCRIPALLEHRDSPATRACTGARRRGRGRSSRRSRRAGPGRRRRAPRLRT